MLDKTRIRIYQAAEDFVQGYSLKQLSEKYKRSLSVISSWKKTKAWQQVVKGRVRQHRKTPAPYDRTKNIATIQAIAHRWIAMGKPPNKKFAMEIGVTLKKLKEWMDSPFWEITVLNAEDEIEKRKEWAQTKKRKGDRIKPHLLKQAVFLYLAGWDMKDIAPHVNRCVSSIKYWHSTEAWAEMQRKIELDKLLMSIMHFGLTVQDMYLAICESQGLRNPTE